MVKKLVWNGRLLSWIDRYEEKQPKEKTFIWKGRVLKLVKVFHEKDKPDKCPVKNCGAPVYLVKDHGMVLNLDEDDPEHYVRAWKKRDFICEHGHKLPYLIAHEKYKILERFWDH